MKYRLLPVIFTAALTSVVTLYVAGRWGESTYITHNSNKNHLPVNYATLTAGGSPLKSSSPVDFQNAAEASVKAVVHIKTATKPRTVVAQDPFGDEFFGNLFGARHYYIPPQMGSGSGVVISPDGYIVTNYHVVSNADEVTVTFNDRFTSQAKVIGADPSTDIALLKVKEKDLPYMEFGNSDNVRLGQWVLAVGYPLTLDATVTAGIVSAKSRAIGARKSQTGAIESYIQTDAAVNPGNSGGALVNTDGQLLGINSAIASPTGSYAGYSYAIPANIVHKVVNDLMQYGSVQRGYLGIEYADLKNVSTDDLRKLDLNRKDGVFVMGVVADGGAAKAGLKKGDLITQVNGVQVTSEPELLEQIARYKPGDNVSVTYIRSGKEFNTTVELKNINGNTTIIKQSGAMRLLGANFRNLNSDERSKWRVKGGVMVTELGRGLLVQQTNMQKGFVITHVNDAAVTSVEELQKELFNASSVQIAGFYPGRNGVYYYGLKNINTDDAEQ